jgi:hypothetical protein
MINFMGRTSGASDKHEGNTPATKTGRDLGIPMVAQAGVSLKGQETNSPTGKTPIGE